VLKAQKGRVNMKERKMKKLLSAILAISLAGSIAPSVLAEETVNDATTEVVTEKKFIEDFEGYEVGTNISALGDLIGSYNSDFSESAIVDDGTGNKVFMLKYNRKNSSYWQHLYMNLGETFESGKYSYSFKFKIVNSDGADWYNRFMVPDNSDGDTDILTSKFGSAVQIFNSTANTYDDLNGLVDSNGYYNLKRDLDLDNLKQYLPIADTYGRTSENISAGTFNRIQITTRHESGSVPAVTGDEANIDYGIVYIDDIEITPIESIKMVSNNTPIGGEVLMSNLAYKAIFDYDLGTVSSANVIVEKDSAIVTEGFSVAKSGKTLTVTFAEELNAGSKYKITATGVAASNALYGTAADTVIADFTAVEATDNFVEDFEDYDIGALPYFMNTTFNVFDGSGIVDDGTGNKVFMLKYNRQNTSYWQHFYMDLGYMFSNKAYNYDYKFKIVNSDGGDWYNYFMSAYDSTNDKIVMQNKLGSKVQFYNNQNNEYSDMDVIKDANGYYNMHQVFDFVNKKVYPPIANIKEASPTTLNNALQFNKIRITTRHEFTSVPEVTGDEANKDYGIIYIDDITINPVESIKLTGKNTAIGSEVLNTNKEYKAFFNQNLGTVSAANVKVEKDGVEITEGFSVTKSADTLTVTFAEDLTVGSKYKITATGISASDAMYGTIKDTVIADFTARDKIDEFTEDFEGFEVGDKPYFVTFFGGNKMQAEVAADETGNKVLKMTYDSAVSGGWYGMRIMLGNDFTMGSYNYDYDVRVVNAQAGVAQPFMTLQNYTSEKSVSLMTRHISKLDNDDATEKVPSFVFGQGYWVLAENMPQTNGYYNVDAYIDIDNRVQGFPLKDGTPRRVWPIEPEDGVDDNPDTEENEAVPGTNTFNAIYTKLITNGNLGIAAPEGSEYFSETVDTYFVDNISITPRRGIWKGEEKIAEVSDAKGGNVTAKIDMNDTNAENFTVIFALYSGNKLEEVKTIDKEEMVNGYAEATLSVPADAEELKLTYMIFDSLNGLKPVGGKGNF